MRNRVSICTLIIGRIYPIHPGCTGTAIRPRAAPAIWDDRRKGPKAPLEARDCGEGAQ